ncbi:MAG: hydroxymethylglutaryl-CoA reductase, degradative [Myxococcales bacterium]|nr:hydroxymethylglutaryl-CoA reductase, degradative [Myxococcales bacterium]
MAAGAHRRSDRGGHHPDSCVRSAGVSSRLHGFHARTVDERRRHLADQGLDLDDLDGGLSLADAAGMIENVVGRYALPLAVATNFTVDGVDALVPMAVEEASIVAAASNAARMARAGGGFTAIVRPAIVTGQIQLVHVVDAVAAAARLTDAAPAILARARALTPRLVARGGGPRAVSARVLATAGLDGGVVVVHVDVDCCDAMGANLVNTLCELLAPDLAARADGAVGLRILTNLTDQRTVTVACAIPLTALADARTDGATVAAGVAAASRFAEADRYRAATHNKGIMNGVDAVLVATGQDWRAVEAGAHAWAARAGGYAPLATWHVDGDHLRGQLELPLAVGTVGGALHVHRGARAMLALAGVTSAARLAALAAAAGLACNLAALRALATDGIQRGHMALHARAVARAAGADGELIDALAAELVAGGDLRPETAATLLTQLKGATLATSP